MLTEIAKGRIEGYKERLYNLNNKSGTYRKGA